MHTSRDDSADILIAGQPLPLLVLKDQNPTLAEGFNILMGLISMHKPDVLFIDPKSMAYGSLDENSNSHNTAFVSCLKKFNELSTSDQNAILKAAGDAREAAFKINSINLPIRLKNLEKTMKITQHNEIDIKAFKELMKPVWNKYAVIFGIWMG